jgi:ketosteroid isomerase-like protein
MDRGLLWPDVSRDTGRAMSQENVEVAKQAYEAFQQRDIDRFLSYIHPEVEWHARLGELEGTHTGTMGSAGGGQACWRSFPTGARRSGKYASWTISSFFMQI